MDYPLSKTVPWDHQKNIWPRLYNIPAFYLAWDMGTGKSKMSVDYMTGVQAQKILVFCPKKGIHVWPRQHAIHSATPTLIYAPEKTLSSAKKALEIEPIIRKHNGPAMIVLNYEAAWRPPLGPVIDKDTNRLIKPGLLTRLGWDLFVCDEAHRIKSPGGKASWNAFRIARASKRKLFLSGTPMPHSPLDAYAQYRALNPRIFGTRFTNFRARYAIMGGAMGKQIFGFQNIEDLNKRFYSCADTVMADDVLELPERKDEYRYVDLPTKTFKLYKELEKEFWIEYNNGEVTAGNALVKMLRLAQLARGIIKLDDGREEYIDNTMINTVADFTKDLPPKEPLIIYTRFKRELQELKLAISNLKGQYARTVGELSGRMDQRQAWEDGRFNTLVIQIQSGSEAIDLTRARYCLYCSTGLRLGDYRQSRRRIRRPGQLRKVIYYHFVANRTVDVKSMKAFADRIEVIDFILRGLEEFKRTGVRPGTKMISDQELQTIK